MGLAADATEKDIKAAYRVLVKVWHPDRFQGDPALRGVAEAKLQEINSAYAFLTTESTARRQPAKPASGDAVPRGPSASNTSTTGRAQRGWTPPAGSPSRASSGRVSSTIGFFFRFVVIVMAILLARYLWIAFDVQDTTSQGVEKAYGQDKDRLSKDLETPKSRFIAAVEKDLERLGLREPPPRRTILLQPEEPATETREQVERKEQAWAPERQAPGSQTAPLKLYPYITVGSTKDEVLDDLGTPTSSTEDKFVYGRSELDFRDNSVVGWRIDPVTSPIRVKLWPQSPVDTSLGSFTVGSSKDVVLVVQGTPTAFSEDKFEYGGSEVYFHNDRVTEWKNDPASVPLRARLP
jgi:hypothetical protein